MIHQHGIRSLVVGVGYESPHALFERLVVADMHKTAERLWAFLRER